MRILTREEASEFFGWKPLDPFVSELSTRLRPVGGTYSIPPDSGKKTALSRLFASMFLSDRQACIYIPAWGIWPSSEHLDLFYGYRRSFGEIRTLTEASVHAFERGEEDTFASILCMTLNFIWDAWIFDVAGKLLMRISHDEWLQVEVNDEGVREEFAAELKKYGVLPFSW